MSIDTSSLVAELVLEQPSRARVFEEFRIDYCCGGNVSLDVACERRGVDGADVAAALETADANALSGSDEQDWQDAPIGELCDHIVAVYHDKLRLELPRLSTLLEKCERAHGGDCPELAPMRATFELLRADLDHHMEHEEQQLFPDCRAGVPSQELVLHLEDEHAAAGAALDRLRELTGGYDLERARCNTHRAAIDGLHELELDMHQHIHKENNILFPRALAATAPG